MDPSPEKQQPAIEPSLNGSTARIRRLSVVGAPPADSEAASSSDNLRQLAEEDGEYPSPRQPESPEAADSKQAQQQQAAAAAAGAGQGEGQKAAAVAKPERTRSAAFRELHEFNLMDRLISSVASLSRAGREPNYRKTNQDNWCGAGGWGWGDDAYAGRGRGMGSVGPVCQAGGLGRRGLLS